MRKWIAVLLTVLVCVGVAAGVSAESASNTTSLHVSADAKLLEAFEMTAEDFAADARLVMAQSAYDALAEKGAATCYMTTASQKVTLSAAVGGQTQLSSMDETKTEVVSFDLLLKQGQGVAEMPTGTTVYLPLPSTLEGHDVWAAAFTDANGTTKPAQVVTVKNGVAEIPVTANGTYTLIGLSESSAEQQGWGYWWATGLIGGGVLLVVAAALLLWLVVFRRVKK